MFLKSNSHYPFFNTNLIYEIMSVDYCLKYVNKDFAINCENGKYR